MKIGKRGFFLLTVGFVLLLAVLFLPTQEITAAAPSINLLTDLELPIEMAIGQTFTIEVEVKSEGEPFIWARALGDDFYPGRGGVIRGGDMIHTGNFGVLSLDVIAKSSTAAFPDGHDPMAVVVGVRYPGGEIHSERFDFIVSIQ